MSPEGKRRILVVDDEENMRFVLQKVLTGEGYLVSLAADGREALELLDRETVDIILSDVRMPVMDGLTFLAELRARAIRVPVIVLSAYGTVDSAMEAIQAGAFDYVFKPFQPDEILLALKKAEEHEQLKNENLALRRAATEKPVTGIVARSRIMADLLTLVDRVARVKSPVLLTGESGTGKELVARAIHDAGDRKDQPFIPVNCGAIPDKLLESELFGHVRGAFTDAVRDRPGLFREANGGTLFLDEVGELPLSLQVKLLRALQEEEVRPVGGAGTIKIEVRIVAATARNMVAEVGNGRFREDLYYRLNVLPLHIPPLRDRPEDIPPLLNHFLVAFSARMGRERPELTPRLLEALVNYHWPGNVRELENLVERLLVLSPKMRLGLDDLPAQVCAGQGGPKAPPSKDFTENLNLKARIRELEAHLIGAALKKAAGNRSEAARMLQISYPSLLAKIKTYKLS